MARKGTWNGMERMEVFVTKDDHDKLDADLIDEDYEPDAEDFLVTSPKEIKPKKNSGFSKKIIVGVIVLALFANIIQFFPRVLNLDVFAFLQTSYELSKDDRIEKWKESIVSIRSDSGNGTGFVINHEEGLILTNHHVVEGGTNLYVHFKNDDFAGPNEVDFYESYDAAVLKMEESLTVPSLPLEADDPFAVGDKIYVVGNPLSFARIANEGKIIGETTVNGIEGPVIMIDAPIYKGNSGSPLLNEEGKVIGLIFATRVTKEDGKVGLAIPIASVEEAMGKNSE